MAAAALSELEEKRRRQQRPAVAPLCEFRFFVGFLKERFGAIVSFFDRQLHFDSNYTPQTVASSTSSMRSWVWIEQKESGGGRTGV